METCSPVSQVGPRDTGDLKGWLPEQQWEPGLGKYLVENCISTTWVCHLGREHLHKRNRKGHVGHTSHSQLIK